ncbi:MAG: hypothetical protein ABEJ58_05005 [Halodesulfurarchaeum sp.]
MSRHVGTPTGIATSRELAHRIETYEDGRECTLYPSGCVDYDLLTHWITAREGDFVDLADMR